MATSAQHLPASPAGQPLSRPGLLARGRSASATTPGRMRVISLVLLLGVLLAWGLSFYALSQRQQAIRTVGSDVAPVVVSSQNIQSLLSGADASAANSFLAGGVEPADQRARYLLDLQQAQDQYARAAAASGLSTNASAALRRLAETVPSYAGLVESARANNRQGFPVGAGYLRRATALLHATILPGAQSVHTDSSARLASGYSAATGSLVTIGVLVAGLVLLVGLVSAQVFLRRRTRRVLNLGLVAATVLSLGLVAWTLFSLLNQASQMNAARERASALDVLGRARVAAYQAKSDESFALIARGNGAAQYADFTAKVAKPGDPGSLTALMAEAARRAQGNPDQQSAVADAQQSLQVYLTAHTQIQALDSSGAPQQAIAKALATGPGSANQAFDSFDQSIQRAASLTQQQGESHLASARSRLSGLSIETTIGFLVVALLVLYGFQQRIQEYR